MKIEYLHASKYGNGAKVAAAFKQQMAVKGVVVDVHHIREVRPTELSPADLYLFSSPGRFGKPIGGMNAPPEDIWPWLIQMGTGRGGLYSYDWLDRLFGFLDRPSATRILPEFQHLAVGDKIPWGRDELTVSVLEPPRALALSMDAHGMEWVWQFGLYPLDDQSTRLVDRGTERVPSTPLWWLGMRIMEPAAFIMTRRFMLGVKQRAETLRASAPVSTVAARTAPAVGLRATS